VCSCDQERTATVESGVSLKSVRESEAVNRQSTQWQPLPYRTRGTLGTSERDVSDGTAVLIHLNSVLPQGATPLSARFGSFNPEQKLCGTSNHRSFACRCPGLSLLSSRLLHRALLTTRTCGGGWAFPMNPLTDPRSSRHRTRMRLFGITRWSCSFPDNKVGCSGEFEAGRVTFAGGV